MVTEGSGPAQGTVPSGTTKPIQQEERKDAPPARAPPKNDQPTGPGNTTPATAPAPTTKPAPNKPVARDNQGPSGEKKLSNAELKAKAKAEKQARRAQQKAAQQAPPASAGAPHAPQGHAGNEAKGGKHKQKSDASQPAASANSKAQSTKQPIVMAPTAKNTDHMADVPECFSHLSMAKRISITQADKDVHPAVLALGQKMGAFALTNSTDRLEATLLAFKQVIDSYTTPQGSTLSRHFTSHVLNPQVEYLSACRPMCFSMGNAVRWLKMQVSKIDIDLPEADAKKYLTEAIDNFLRERIHVADVVIVELAADLISPQGDLVVTFMHDPLVERALLHARLEQQKNFRVMIIDDPLEPTGRALVPRLSEKGIRVSYVPHLAALGTLLQEASLVFFGAESMFSNGAMYACAGTCDVALFANDLGVPVIGLCSTINFTERVAIDSQTYNEIDPDHHTADSFRLLFDTTPDKYITAVVTELGKTAPASVPVIMRKLEEL
ncbi:nagb/rpia/CoA transferase-like protein [Sodiomyces alkalinus F11]|uniref:Translation initiation factor eIF2B subunit delta n=1 Tax=Sodiomyces alkalinus (strain CBS 110278 / VKM F-3762 / F11) TaxID=1314773 RepID=A0A3N2PWL4_SODAK|nr:nagb/rpia/CoA transferase-like protein [Sodiomyces alkalinus F11]ROT38919.1 nagb/rpia/CoA transferase-like protein [Sodiomyces alkalinus F11]